MNRSNDPYVLFLLKLGCITSFAFISFVGFILYIYEQLDDGPIYGAWSCEYSSDSKKTLFDFYKDGKFEETFLQTGKPPELESGKYRIEDGRLYLNYNYPTEKFQSIYIENSQIYLDESTLCQRD